jgi:hypothetical protein
MNHRTTVNLPTSQITGTNYPFPGNGNIRGTIISNYYEVFLLFLVQSPWIVTLRNSTKFSIFNSLIQFSDLLLATNRLSLYRASTKQAENTCHVSDCVFFGPLITLGMAGQHRKHLLFFVNTRHGPQQKTQPLYCCVTPSSKRECVQCALHNYGPCTEHRKHCSCIVGSVCVAVVA